MRVVIRTSMRRRGAFNHRIEYLAEVRNAAMVPLHELRENEGEVFDSVVFMNDVLPCIDDVLELIWQSRRQNAGLTCAADYMFHDGVVSLFASITILDIHTFCREPPYFTTTGSPAISMAQLSKMRHLKQYSIILHPRIASSAISLSKCSPAGMVSLYSTQPLSTLLLTSGSAWRALLKANALLVNVV